MDADKLKEIIKKHNAFLLGEPGLRRLGPEGRRR
jgi:hypothetical protein